ncbi:MAG: 2'-5' RNA ligase family protein [Kineosporiaceae bacterium]
MSARTGPVADQLAVMSGEPAARPGRHAAPGPVFEDPPTMTMPVSALLALDTVTIGVAVMVPEPWGSHLQECRASFGDPQAGAIPTHITLLPPTSLPRRSLAQVRAHLAAVAATTRPFRIGLRGTGTFRPVSPVVYVAVAAGAGSCDRLQRAVRSGPLARELAFPYHPHVTVAHDVVEDSLTLAEESLRDFEAGFGVEELWLYEHGADGVWRPQEQFRFTTAG